MVDSAGNFLQTFPVDKDGNSTSVSLTTTQPVQIPDTAGSPGKTDNIGLQMNLNAGDKTFDPANFDPDDPDTFNNSTSVTMYDSLGEPHVMTTYFVRPPNAAHTGESNWVAFYAVDGKKVKGYREEDGVHSDSTTETYAAIKFFVDNWRWADVPFYVRTAKKCLPK